MDARPIDADREQSVTMLRPGKHIAKTIGHDGTIGIKDGLTAHIVDDDTIEFEPPTADRQTIESYAIPRRSIDGRSNNAAPNRSAERKHHECNQHHHGEHERNPA